MSLSQHILGIWANSQYPPPRIPLIYNENQYMVTVDDTGIFLRFMSSDGQIFMAINRNCQTAKSDPTIGTEVYICTKVDPILCSPTPGLEHARDIFVLKNIAPLIA